MAMLTSEIPREISLHLSIGYAIAIGLEVKNGYACL